MFAKISRYRKLPDVVTVDAQGRMLASKDLRMLPQVTGAFRHTVTAVDRLDQLAYKYYNQPRKWWQICDANPQFLSPEALLGPEAVVTVRFPLTVTGGDPPWAALFDHLRALLGVEDIQVEEGVAQAPGQQIVNGQPVPVWVDRYSRAVLVTYNPLNVDTASLATAIVTAGFDLVQPTVTGQLGQPIVIPPNVIG
jgi:hypothetical protein